MFLKSRSFRSLTGLVVAAVVFGFVTMSMRAQGGQPTITTTFSGPLPAGPDFATDVLADPWDMSNPEDLSPDPTETGDWIAPTIAGGLFTGTTAGVDSAIGLLHRGYYGIINPGRNGINFPINTSKYRKLAFRISYASANEQPQVYWFHNPWTDPAAVDGELGASIGVQFTWKMPAGYQVLVLDMTKTDRGVPWTAADRNGSTHVVGLRIDPNSGAVASNQVSLDWVRLTAADGDTANGAVSQTIAWSGGAGTSTIDVYDSAGATSLLTIASALSSATTSYDWNYGILPPGHYNLCVTRGGVRGPLKAFTINNPPIIKITDPDETGGQDYATTVMGNPWNMDSLNDVKAYQNITAPSIVNGEFTATNTNGDPLLEMLNNSAAPIDTSKYRYLTYTLTVDGAYDLGNGSVARVFWTSAPSLDGGTATTSKDIIVWPGKHTYTIDLAGLTVGNGGLEPSGPQDSWAPIGKRYFRFDPLEFGNPHTFHVGPMKLAAMDESNGSFTIRWAGSDPDGGTPGVALYYDNDKNPSNGRTLIASALSMASGSYLWSTSGVTPGVYYIYAEASDGIQTYGRYSTGPIRVIDPTAMSSPNMALDGPANGSTVIEPFTIGGWAIDQGAPSGSGVDTVHIWAQPSAGGASTFVGVASYFGARSDVGSIFGAQFSNSGFGFLVNNLAPGTYTLTAYAHSAVTNTFNQARSTTITIPASNTLLNIDAPADLSTISQPMFITGWAIDLASPLGTGVDTVHLWAYPNPGSGDPPVFLGITSYGSARGDIGAAFGSRFTNSGFTWTAPLLPAGKWRVVAFAHSLVSGAFNGVKTTDVVLSPPSAPAMSIDGPGTGASIRGAFVVGGWAIDRAAASGTGVDAIHIWAFPVSGVGGAIFAGSGGYGGSRPDVASAFGSRFATSGFNTWVSGLPPGTYTLVVFARSTATGTFNQSQSIQVTIQ